jgi:hypothetical protein
LREKGSDHQGRNAADSSPSGRLWVGLPGLRCRAEHLIDQKLAAFQDYAQNFMGMNDEKADQLAQKIVALDYQDPERPRGLILPRGEPNPVSDGPSNRFDPADR